jgi:hypothetical protein
LWIIAIVYVASYACFERGQSEFSYRYTSEAGKRSLETENHTAQQAVVERVCDENLEQGARYMPQLYSHQISRVFVENFRKSKFFNRRNVTTLA